MTATRDGDSGGAERSMNLAKMSLEQLLYYVLVELTGKQPGILAA